MADKSLRMSTAVRALPSTLASRAAPTVPPASQTYEPLVKSVLRHRLLSRTFVYSAIFSWALVVLASSIRGGRGNFGLVGLLLNPILPRTLVFAFVVWLFSVVPVIVTRKAYLTGTWPRMRIGVVLHHWTGVPNAATSPASVFNSALHKSSTLRAFLGYMLSISIVTFIHVLTAQASDATSGNDTRLTLFVKSRRVAFPITADLID